MKNLRIGKESMEHIITLHKKPAAPQVNANHVLLATDEMYKAEKCLKIRRVLTSVHFTKEIFMHHVKYFQKTRIARKMLHSE